MSSARRFFSGNTEAQAVMEAATQLDIPPSELGYTLIDKKTGFLRQRKVTIAVDPTSPRRAIATTVVPAAAVPAPAAPRPVARAEAAVASPGQRPASVEQVVVAAPAPHPRPTFADALPAAGTAGAVQAATALLELSGLRLAATAAVAADELHVELDGEDRPALVARDAEVLRTLEQLLRRMVRETAPEGLSVDSAGYRAQRESDLRRRAQAAAAAVRDNGGSVLLEPLPAAERRVVHLAIQDEPGVASVSEGDGESKRVRIVAAPTGAG